MSKATIRDVAREAGVSAQTVSRVLNSKDEVSPETRQKVKEVIRRLGYRPSRIARGLTTSRTGTIGLTIPSNLNLYFAEVALGVQETAWDRGYTVIQGNSTDDVERERAILEVMESQWVDGVLCCSPRLPMDELVPLLERHPAAVVIHRSRPREGIGAVVIDDSYGISRAVNHLLEIGRKKLAFLCGAQHSYSATQRLNSFVEALEAAGLQADPELIVQFTSGNGPYDESARQWSTAYAAGENSTCALLEAHPDVDGIICFNDELAIGALRACQQLELRVPEDVAIVGCDDTLIARLVTPPLTTLALNKYEVGASAARMLIGKIEGRTELGEIILRHELVVRASTSRAPSSK